MKKNTKKFNVKIIVDGWYFDLYTNNKILDRGKMSAKDWSKFAPFTGKMASIKVDYLYIENIMLTCH